MLKKDLHETNKIEQILFFMIGITFVLAGCAPVPEYKRPESPIPSNLSVFETGLKSGEKTSETGVGKIPWRKFFTDRCLQNVIESALDYNRDLRLAALNVKRARAMYNIKRSDLFPALNADAGGSKKRMSGKLSSNNQSTEIEQYDINLGVIAWEVDFFGRLRSLKEKALYEFMATEQACRSARILIIYEVASAYLKLAADIDNLRLAKTTFETQKEASNLIKRRFEVGIATELDFNRSITQMESARREVAYFIQEVEKDKNALGLLTGYKFKPARDILSEGLGGIRHFKDFFAGVSSDILLKRPDIMQAESNLKASYANIGAARAALFPRISLTTSAGTASRELSGLFEAGTDTWNFASRIIMPVFDARLWSALHVTKTAREIALTQYEKTLQTAFREVEDSLAVTASIEKQLAAQQSLVEAAAKTYRLSRVRYKKGIDSYLSVLDSQRFFYEAQRGLVTLVFSKRVNQARFYAVLGGGVDYEIE